MGVAHQGVADPSDAVPVSTHACLASLVLAGLRVVVAAAVVLLVQGCLSRPMAGLFAVGSLALQQAFVRSDVVVVMPVAVFVGNVPVSTGPAWYVLTVRHPPIVGDKSSDSWYDRWKKLPNLVRHALSHPGGSFSRTTHHLVFRSALRPFSQLRLCSSYVHPRRWQGPFGPPCCIPVLPMGAPGCCFGSVVRCSCLCLPARRVPYRAMSRGLYGWRVGAAVRFLAVRVSRLVLWCRGFRLAQRAGFGVRLPCPLARAGGLAGPVGRADGPLRAPGGGPEGRNTGQCRSPPSLLDAVNFLGGGERVPRTILARYMC